MPGRIFINYRREDAAATAGRLHDSLAWVFCRKNIFMDVDKIPPGVDFAEFLKKQVSKCDVLLAVIGPKWLDMRDQRGLRRLDDPEDFVAIEIAAALERTSMFVIPVLVDGARMPAPTELPKRLCSLATRNAVELRNKHFGVDVSQLIKKLRKLVAAWCIWLRWMAAAAALLLIVGAVAFQGGLPLSSSKVAAVSIDSFRDCADVCPEMVVAPAGEFWMGSPDTEDERGPEEGERHKVTFVKAFAVSRAPITRAEFEAFVRETGHDTGNKCHTYENEKWEERADRSYRSPGFPQETNHPVVCVNWDDARKFATWLSEKTGRPYRLLSEAEREYVTRAGSTTPFWWPGRDISTDQANYDGNYTYGSGAKGPWRKKTVAVDSFKYNPWGLYQVHGNVYDWVEDCWHDSYKGAPPDGTAWTTGECKFRVVRGGSWYSRPKFLRSANRLSQPMKPDLRISDIGFRVARSL